MPFDRCQKSLDSVAKLGYKTVFVSDSFAAYRREALFSVGGFPRDVILGEDIYVASKMILANWKVYYCTEARAYHSHNYSLLSDSRRYFDTGVFHSANPWIIENFGRIEDEGYRFILKQLEFIFLRNPPFNIPGHYT